MMALFFWGNPRVFSDWRIYYSVLTTLPVAIFLVVPLVFIVTVGEIDLSFPAVMGFAAWIFALGVQAGLRSRSSALPPAFSSASCSAPPLARSSSMADCHRWWRRSA